MTESTIDSQASKKIVLKTAVQGEITTFNNYALPLCVIYGDLSKSKWVYEHFSQIYMLKNESNYVWLDYLEEADYPCDVLDYRFAGYNDLKDIEDIVGFLKKHIDIQYQIMLLVDYDCIKQRRYHPIRHFLIQIYLYGYDDAEKQFYGIGFRQDSTFGELKYNYDEIRRGFASMKDHNDHSEAWIDWYTGIFMKVKEPGKIYECSINTIIKGLYDYFSSADGRNKLRPEFTVKGVPDVVFGMDAQQEVIKSLYRLLDGEFIIDFRAIHLLEEQKKLNYKKLELILGQTDSLCDKNSLLKQYSGVCRDLNKARLMYMMQVLIDSDNLSLYAQLKDTEVIKNIIHRIEHAAILEKNIFSELFSTIKFNCKQD